VRQNMSRSSKTCRSSSQDELIFTPRRKDTNIVRDE
jgi:hypothetical protein